MTGTPTTGGGDGGVRAPRPRTAAGRNGLIAAVVYDGATFNGNTSITKRLRLQRGGRAQQLLPGQAAAPRRADRLAPPDRRGRPRRRERVRQHRTTGTIAGRSPGRSRPLDLSNIADFEDQVPASVREACTAPVTATTECGVLGLLRRPRLHRAAGARLLPGPGDPHLPGRTRSGTTCSRPASTGPRLLRAHSRPTGGDACTEIGREHRAGRTAGGLRRAPLRVPHGHRHAAGLAAVLTAKTKSIIIGGFVQDSWSILDKVTLNVGLRYDTLHLHGRTACSASRSRTSGRPRIGVVWDPTQQGRSKIFANYGRYYEYIPLDIADRALTGESLAIANHDCDPRAVGVAGCDLDHGQPAAQRRDGPTSKWRTSRSTRLRRTPT